MKFILLGPENPKRISEIRMEPETPGDEYLLWSMAEVGVASLEIQLRDGTEFEALLQPESLGEA